MFIPPHSAHAPGVLTGLVLGNCHRIHTLCSNPADVLHLSQLFFNRLIRRGYSPNILLPLFKRADALASSSPHPYDQDTLSPDEKLKSQIFFHIEYHPNSVTSSKIQSLWKNTVILPSHEPHFNQVENHHGHQIEVNQMTIAYSRPPNLGNLLSSRNLHTSSGPPVSSYRK